MSKLSLAVFLMVASATITFAQTIHQPKLTPQNSNTTQLLISVSPVSDRVVWAAGTHGTYVVTTDGGNTWRAGTVPGAQFLQFRDVQGVSDQIAYLMSIGNGTEAFRIYKTEDGGATWKVQFTNKTPNAFYDCFAFWTPDRGITHSDSVNGVFPDIRTTNGTTWESISANMPPALSGEASFSASGTCIATEGTDNAWISTGGSSIARILATTDGGNTWNAYDTPLFSSPSAGGISVAFIDSLNGVLAGGDLSNNASAQFASSSDGGQTWTLTPTPPVEGAIFCLALVRGQPHGKNGYDQQPGNPYNQAVVVTSEAEPSYSAGDAAWTPDFGQTWYALPGVSGYWAVAFANQNAGWFVGNNGKILKISF
jgi:photosystem II stability/assembly factor-like uncharacterized protein